MTTQQVIDIARRITQIDPRISAHANGGTITGTFRGKAKEDYSYLLSAKTFIFNNEGPNVKKAVDQAVTEILN